MGVGLMVMKDHDVLVVGELCLGKVACSPLDRQRVGATGHGQHDVERLATVPNFRDLCSSIAPVVAGLLQGFLAGHRAAELVLDLEPPFFAM
jgi:hypothetical protein